MYVDNNSEVITLAEALTRVGLSGLISSVCHDMLIEWTGYPQLFSCGYDATIGFGPVWEEKENDEKGSGRWYQEKVRVAQAFCGGTVLFSWGIVWKDRKMRTNRRATISIDHTPDRNDTVLRLVFPG